MAEGGALRELISLFTLGVDSKELERGSKEVEGFVAKLKKVGGVIVEAFAVRAVGEFITSQVEAAAHVEDLSKRLGVGAGELQAFGFAARLAGVEGESAAHSLGFLNKAIGDALGGSKEASDTFAKLGITLRGPGGQARELGDVLGDVADAFKAMPDQQTRAATAMKLFGREGQALLPVLAGGSEELGKLRQEFEQLGGGMSDDFVAAAKKTDDEMAKVGLGMQAIRSRIVGALLPGFSLLVDKVKGLTIGFLDFTKRTYFLQTAMIALSAGAAYKLLGTLGALGRTLGLLKPSIAETVAALWEFAVPALIVGALYVAFDEIFTLMKGGKTVIGDTLNELTGDATASTKAALYLRAGWEDVKTGAEALAGVIAGVLIPIFVSLWYTIKGIGSILKDVFTGNFGDISKDIDEANKGINDAIEAGKRTIASSLKDGTGRSALNNVSDELAGGQGPLNFDALSDRAAGQTYKKPAYTPKFDFLGSNAGNLGDRDFSAQMKAFEAYERRAKAPAKATAPRAAAAASAPAPQRGAAPITINQTNHFEKANGVEAANLVGKATGQGVAHAHQKDMNNALVSVRRP